MTEQEIERLRDKLGDGFEVTEGYNCAVITLKDIWKGVEFASHIFDDEVYRVSEIVGDQIWNTKGTWFSKKVAKPSTEAAYVEQLKAKAHELYGEIKDGDRFDYSELYSGVCHETIDHISDWYYMTSNDCLYTARECHGGFIIYKQGKWAKKVEEPIRVDCETISGYEGKGFSYMEIRFRSNKPNLPFGGSKELETHLAKCLEDYLNNS